MFDRIPSLTVLSSLCCSDLSHHTTSYPPDTHHLQKRDVEFDRLHCHGMKSNLLYHSGTQNPLCRRHRSFTPIRRKRRTFYDPEASPLMYSSRRRDLTHFNKPYQIPVASPILPLDSAGLAEISVNFPVQSSTIFQTPSTLAKVRSCPNTRSGLSSHQIVSDDSIIDNNDIILPPLSSSRGVSLNDILDASLLSAEDLLAIPSHIRETIQLSDDNISPDIPQDPLDRKHWRQQLKYASTFEEPLPQLPPTLLPSTPALNGFATEQTHTLNHAKFCADTQRLRLVNIVLPFSRYSTDRTDADCHQTAFSVGDSGLERSFESSTCFFSRRRHETPSANIQQHRGLSGLLQLGSKVHFQQGGKGLTRLRIKETVSGLGAGFSVGHTELHHQLVRTNRRRHHYNRHHHLYGSSGTASPCTLNGTSPDSDIILAHNDSTEKRLIIVEASHATVGTPTSIDHDSHFTTVESNGNNHQTGKHDASELRAVPEYFSVKPDEGVQLLEARNALLEPKHQLSSGMDILFHNKRDASRDRLASDITDFFSPSLQQEDEDCKTSEGDDSYKSVNGSLRRGRRYHAKSDGWDANSLSSYHVSTTRSSDEEVLRNKLESRFSVRLSSLLHRGFSTSVWLCRSHTAREKTLGVSSNSEVGAHISTCESPMPVKPKTPVEQTSRFDDCELTKINMLDESDNFLKVVQHGDIEQLSILDLSSRTDSSECKQDIVMSNDCTLPHDITFEEYTTSHHCDGSPNNDVIANKRDVIANNKDVTANNKDVIANNKDVIANNKDVYHSESNNATTSSFLGHFRSSRGDVCLVQKSKMEEIVECQKDKTQNQNRTSSASYQEIEVNNDSADNDFKEESMIVMKVVHKVKCSDEELGRLSKEVEFLVHLEHPHILNLLSFVDSPTEQWMFFEHAPLGDLYHSTVFKSLLEDDARWLTLQVLLAIHSLHEKYHIIHSDVKPHNILLFEDPSIFSQYSSPFKQYWYNVESCCKDNKTTSEATAPNGIKNWQSIRLKLCDFGLAQQPIPYHQPIEFDGLRGTHGYFAPELLLRHSYDYKIDMWALGIIVFTLIGGYEPFFPVSSCTKEDVQFDPRYWSNISTECKNFIRGLLQSLPSKRLSSQEALNHDWIRSHFMIPHDLLYHF